MISHGPLSAPSALPIALASNRTAPSLARTPGLRAIGRWVGFCLAILSIIFEMPIAAQSPTERHVAIIPMDSMLLPGTSAFYERSLREANARGAALVVVELDTPGGILQTTQDMVQQTFQSPVPVVVYISPTGATATSAGVFLTMAAHVAAMSPGTTIGAAHPVSGDGTDIEGDMRSKVENAAIAMAKTIAEQRGRNVDWATKAVKESSSLTEREAREQKVIDLLANDLTDLLHQLEGRSLKVRDTSVTLNDLTALPRIRYAPSAREEVINVLANPTVAALLWLGATTGLSLELYNPGAILPGVVGVICLVLALAVQQVIPLNQGSVLLIIVGSLLMVGELFIPSGALGIGGLIAVMIGAAYLVDAGEAPGLGVDMTIFVPIALVCAAAGAWLVYLLAKSRSAPPVTGREAMVGKRGQALESFAATGQIQVGGEVWKAILREGVVAKGDAVVVMGVKDGLTLEVTRAS